MQFGSVQQRMCCFYELNKAKRRKLTNRRCRRVGVQNLQRQIYYCRICVTVGIVTVVLTPLLIAAFFLSQHLLVFFPVLCRVSVPALNSGLTVKWHRVLKCSKSPQIVSEKCKEGLEKFGI